MPLSPYSWPTSITAKVTGNAIADTLAVYDRLGKLITLWGRRGRDVVDYGATGNGITDDTAAIQACIDASAAGDTILFPSGTYLVSSPIVYKPFRAYRGLGPSWGDQTVIKAANGSSANFQSASGHSGVLVPESWNNNTTTASGPVDFRDLMIHGNKTNNATGQHHGLILYGEYWCLINRMRFFDNKKSGLYRTTLAKNGVATMAAGISDNRFEDIFCASNGEHGALKSATGGVIHTDEVWGGTNLFFDNGLSGFWDDRADGFRGNNFHLSNNGQHGVYVLDTGFAFKLEGLYVESFGTTAAAATTYFGVRIKCVNAEPPILSNANIRTTDPAGTSSFICLAIEGADTDAHVYLSNVHLMGAGTSRGHGVNYNVGSGSKLTVHETNLGAVGFTAGQDKEIAGLGTIVFPAGVTRTNVQSGTTYTLTLLDSDKAVELTSASAVTVTIPANVFPAGTVVEITRMGTGSVTLSPGAGMTIRTSGTLVLRAQYSTVTLRFRSTTETVLAGDTT